MKNNFRTGIGFDVHQFAEGRKLIIGGITIPNDRGLLGHSDADVLLHAIADALLGAASLGDIGQHFPDTDSTFKNADSKNLLHQVVELIHKNNYEIENVDSTLTLQAPKLAPFIPEMKKVIASILNIEESRVSVKATTTEHLGFVGREEGAAAFATVLIYKK
ncbi:MAG TPA: 2-C-methyl-D-erythritol 2,4-cyclodiphosphate synthase [Ignavibacteriaceae bacterium]|nr:2-C-methyl-D-erythritol 2,4-cyclodiphosphate synthase [Ignavibacteriaceae bacterium]